MCFLFSGRGDMPFSTDNLTQGMQLADGTDLRQVTVLSKADWERIQTQLHRKQIEEERTQKIREEREEKQRRSKEMIKDWGNTIAVRFSCLLHHLSSKLSLKK